MNLITQARRYRWIFLSKIKIKKQINTVPENQKLKIILGSGGTSFDGWIATDFPHFDITKEKNWKYFFLKRKIDTLVAEHVLEHLTEGEVEKVLKLAFLHMKPGGIFRIAVPDGYHPDPRYIEYVKPGGIGSGCNDHKMLWNYKSLTKIATAIGLSFELQEYFNEEGIFFLKEYSLEHGFIERSKKNDLISGVIPNYTSLIIDLKKKSQSSEY